MEHAGRRNPRTCPPGRSGSGCADGSEKGVDLQNEPFSGIWPIPVGHNWPCDIATHLKDTLELGKNGIAVISGGVSGLNSKSGWENWPSVVFDCEAVDVIGIHG